MSALPRGTVTFLFTDLEVSTRLWEQEPDAMRAALARHDVILREAVETHEGEVVKGTGDGVHAVFATADGAVGAAIAAQVALVAEDWPVSESLRVRMGLHTGVAELREGDYYGGAVNRAARLMAIAHGGQVVCSQATADLVRDALAEGVSLVDLGEHRLRDLLRPERVFQVTAPGVARDFPRVRSLDAFPGNLPLQVSSLIGRDQQIAGTIDALGDSRVVTLTGVGGVGKTRLALQVAAEMLPGFGDGAWLVELAGVREPDAVSEEVVATFGLQPRAGSTARETLLEFLRTKSLLVVLDNCEHLLRAVGDLVAQVVRTCPGVRVLATSREALNVAGERILGVASLNVPEDGAPLEVMGSCDAVILFVERARAVKASFALDRVNGDAVAQVCRRLDGIPLAIELAAARVGMLTPAELAGRLDQRFRILAGGQRSGGVERHETLRATIDWSYELLAEAEQLLLARLSVFVGGFTLHAAEAVGDGGAVEADSVFELLAHLVGHHLVEADDTGVETRYRLLETIRQYAQDRLDDSGDAARLHTVHAVYYTAFGEDAIANTGGPDGSEWERRLERDFDNLRAALTWAAATGEVDTAVRLLGMWDAQPLFASFVPASIVDRAVDAVLALPGAAEHTKYPAALLVAANCALAQGDLDLARRRCTDALAAQEHLKAAPSIGLPLLRALIALNQGHTDEGVEYSGQALEMARTRDEPVWLALALARSANVHALAGDVNRARADAEEILALRHRLANTRAVQHAVVTAAWALRDSEPERALALIRQTVAVAAPGEYPGVGWVSAGDIAAYNGQRREALAYFDQAIESSAWLGIRPLVGGIFSLVAALLADDDPEAAAVLFGAADALAPAMAHTNHNRKIREQATATLTQTLGESRRAQLHAQGATMNDADATDYAYAAIKRALSDDHAQIDRGQHDGR
jgi:predicted ATPase/class 3 adenylate cyclase